MEIEGKMIRVNQYLIFNPKQALMFLIFLISCLMLTYLLFDLIFGFSIRSLLKDCTRYDKNNDYQFLGKIFDQAKDKFAVSNVKLYIKNSPEINAFAIGSLGKKAIVITHGLVNHYLQNSASQEEFLAAIRSILGHEMSHLINKDSFPGIIITVNQKVTDLVSGIFKRLFLLINRVMLIFMIQERYSNYLINTIYTLTNYILTLFNSYIVYNVYNFLRKFANRANEYRADRQSAQAFGGNNMANALSMLGKSGYFTLFSTHPATIKRIEKVQNIESQSGIITPSILNLIFYYLSLFLLLLICIFCAKLSRTDFLIEKYLINNHQMIYEKLTQFWVLIKGLATI